MSGRFANITRKPWAAARSLGFVTLAGLVLAVAVPAVSARKWSFSSLSTPQVQGQPEVPRSAVVAFRLSHGIIVVIPGTIGQLHNLRFAVDTGTTQTVIDRRVAQRLRLLCKAQSPLLNFDRRVPLKQCTLPELEVGSLRLERLNVGVAKLTWLSTLLDEADVLIGLDVLGASKFTIDYPSQEVNFESMQRPVLNPTSDPDDPIILTAAIDVQGRPVRVIIDTGARGLLLYEERLRNKVPQLRILGSVEEVSLGRRLRAKRVIVPGVQFGRTETTSVVLLIEGPPGKGLSDIDGFLGVSALGARRLTLDFIGKTLSWEK